MPRGGGLLRFLLRLDRFFFFYLSVSKRGKKGLRDRKREEDYVAVVNAAARREGEIWLDLSVRPTYVPVLVIGRRRAIACCWLTFYLLQCSYTLKSSYKKNAIGK